MMSTWSSAAFTILFLFTCLFHRRSLQINFFGCVAVLRRVLLFRFFDQWFFDLFITLIDDWGDHFSDICVSQSRSLKVFHIKLCRHGLSIFSLDFPVVNKIDFVASQLHDHAGADTLVDARHPLGHGFERGGLRQVEHNYQRVGFFVEALGNIVILLLACAIPEKHCEIMAVNCRLRHEFIDANCLDMLFVEQPCVIHVQKRRLSDRRVADNHDVHLEFFPNWAAFHHY